MSNQQWTPGPWHVNKPYGKASRDILNDDQLVVARVKPGRDLNGQHHAKTNARLIAAAPALVEALEEIVTDCPKCQGEGWVWGDELDDYDVQNAPSPDDTRYTCDRCRKARAALRAAKGEETT